MPLNHLKEPHGQPFLLRRITPLNPIGLVCLVLPKRRSSWGTIVSPVVL